MVDSLIIAHPQLTRLFTPQLEFLIAKIELYTTSTFQALLPTLLQIIHTSPVRQGKRFQAPSSTSPPCSREVCVYFSQSDEGREKRREHQNGLRRWVAEMGPKTNVRYHGK